jgi:hypothetical protein
MKENNIPKNKEEFNHVPMYYCKTCFGIKIINEGDGLGSYCDDCGSVSIGRTDIDIWRQLYREKYGKDFLIKREDEECKCGDN